MFFSSSLSGQEKSLNSSHLCQKLQCLSSQSQESSAPGLCVTIGHEMSTKRLGQQVCAGGLLVLPTLWERIRHIRINGTTSAHCFCFTQPKSTAKVGWALRT
ncbi:hypothetical protein RLOC_00003157 [Lonchura striata]|uniref:Uncharacterized protein n=1 Tax=Lonchura striata TaxID=40157 RepID=A0A218V334_9PASE|nr:hypothetical protein RLOC_00003157 [Lonchura striata domestica]